MKVKRFLKQFNWRFLLVRILVNAIALALTAALVPKIYFVDRSIWNWLLMAIMLGVLNALIKPVLQILTMQFLFVTFGLVIVMVNTLILWLCRSSFQRGLLSKTCCGLSSVAWCWGCSVLFSRACWA